MLRTVGSNNPSGTCTCAVTTGVPGTSVNDQSNSVASYTTKYPVQSAQANIRLNNRDFAVPEITIDTYLQTPLFASNGYTPICAKADGTIIADSTNCVSGNVGLPQVGMILMYRLIIWGSSGEVITLPMMVLM